MGKQDKLLGKLGVARKVFPWNELVTLLTQLGYEKKEMSGSRVRFYHKGRDALCSGQLIPDTVLSFSSAA